RTVKRLCADDSGRTSVKVGHRQAFIAQNPAGIPCGVLSLWRRDYCSDSSIGNAVSGMQQRECCKGIAVTGMQDRNLLKTPTRLAPRGGFVFVWIGCSAV
ncbi:MAG: hypothetical protein ACN6PM_15605, partial [Achromobacter mucicolens]|uniref:hypothetical protein n=1 Tax=Achromobacter mucicolens TaxID=1389922 RepID=UPI003D0A360D